MGIAVSSSRALFAAFALVVLPTAVIGRAAAQFDSLIARATPWITTVTPVAIPAAPIPIQPPTATPRQATPPPLSSPPIAKSVPRQNADRRCGERGGLGLRDRDGRCVARPQMRQRCGYPPELGCMRENGSVEMGERASPAVDAERRACAGCGCKGGSGFRAPSDSAYVSMRGKCVGWRHLAKVCGTPATERCTDQTGLVLSSAGVDGSGLVRQVTTACIEPDLIRVPHSSRALQRADDCLDIEAGRRVQIVAGSYSFSHLKVQVAGATTSYWVERAAIAITGRD
jgi:hypothetical protein